tara:strand:- start:7658 stop:8401 length:744 start_codon:yes stop_codon:yes gene_type:complete
MDINEMHLAVQQGVDKINSFQADTLLPQEIDLELNKAINKFVNLKYGKNNLYGKGFEESQKRIDDLRTLLKTKKIQASFDVRSVHSTFVYKTEELPTDYRYYIQSFGEIQYRRDGSPLTDEEQNLGDSITNKVAELVQLKFAQLDDITTLLADPFHTTKRTRPLFTIEDNVMRIFTNDIFIIEELKLTYLKNPAKVSLSLDNVTDSVSCELAEHTHQEIVDMTINSILEGISDPRYKTQSIELGKNE